LGRLITITKYFNISILFVFLLLDKNNSSPSNLDNNALKAVYNAGKGSILPIRIRSLP